LADGLVVNIHVCIYFIYVTNASYLKANCDT
jgi:hypothetical protein